MEESTAPAASDNISLDEAVKRRTAELAKHYIAAFDKLLAGMHPAMLVHPDTVLVVENKEEAAAYRALLDAKGLEHIQLQRKPTAKKKTGKRPRYQHPS
jgi:hypothetical protein